MNTRLRFSLKSLLVSIAFAALAFAWRSDHQRLSEEITDARRENAMLRQSLRGEQVKIDTLFGQTLTQEHTINRLTGLNDLLSAQLANAAVQTLDANE